MPSPSRVWGSHGGREHDAGFSSMPRSRRRLLGGLPRIGISQPPEGPDSLAAGKNAGNFFDSAVFCENLSRKHLRIQLFADEFPTRTAQGIFLPAQGIYSARREWQGIRRKTDPLAPTHPIAPKMLPRIDWIRKYSTPVAGADEHAWLLWIGRALDARAEPRIKSADVHDETEAQRLFPGVALAISRAGRQGRKLLTAQRKTAIRAPP